MSGDGVAPTPPNGTPLGGESSGSLRQRALRGGAFMVGREGIGVAIRFVGLTLVVRLIGPASYGVYAAAAAFVAVAALSAQGGAEVFLIRQRTEPSSDLYAQAFTYLLVASVVVTAVSIGLSFAAKVVVRSEADLDVFRVLVLSVPVNVLWAPAQAAIERRMNFAQIGTIEAIGDFVLYAVAVPLAFAHSGPWCLVAGFIAWQTWLLVASWAVSGLKPRLRWSSATSSQLVLHGTSYAASSWIDSVGALVVPVVVGSYAGAAGIGLVSFANRIVDTASFAQRSGWRVGIVSMSQVSDNERLRRGLEEGALLQFLVLALPFTAIAVAARGMVPVLFGHQWSPAVAVMALLGLSAVLRAPIIIQTTLLYAKGRNNPVILATTIRVCAVAAASVLLVPSVGIVGYGIASLLAPVSVLYTDVIVRRHLVRFSYRALVPFVLGLVPIMTIPLVPLPWSLLMFAPACVVLTLRRPRQDIARTYWLVRNALARPKPAPD